MFPYVMLLLRSFLEGMWNRWWMFPSQCLWYWISSFHKNEHSNDLLSKLSTHVSLQQLFLEGLRNRWLMFPYPPLLLVLHAFRSTKRHLLALQLPGWTLRRSNSKGFFALFPDPKKSANVTSQSSADLIHVVCRHWVDENDDAWTVLEAAQGTFLAQLPHATLQVAPAVEVLSRAAAGGARGQGLGIPWPLLGCPCRLWGRLNILESTASSSRTSGWGPVVMQWHVPLQVSCLQRL